MDGSGKLTFDAERLREQEFPRLKNLTYVDYTGGGQAPDSVIDQYAQLLKATSLGNPHSTNESSSNSTGLVEDVRARLLDHVNAQGQYSLVFTSNASNALGILKDSFPWRANSTLILSEDNHNSVLGMRTEAQKAGAKVRYWRTNDELRLEESIGDIINSERERDPGREIIVAFPAQSNFTGVKHPLSAVQEAKALGATVILDTAAFLPTNNLDLQKVPVDAIVMSLYKILGLPTGVGALIIKNELLEKLQKRGFAGGTVKMVSEHAHVLRNGHERFENGTLNYAGIPMVTPGLDFIDNLGGIEAVHQHVQRLTAQALSDLNQIENVDIYGPRNTHQRGGTIACNILGGGNQPIPYRDIERAARERRIDLRGGCFCNPVLGAKALGVGPRTIERLLQRMEAEPNREIEHPGAVRISFGLANTPADITKVSTFIRDMAKTA